MWVNRSGTLFVAVVLLSVGLSLVYYTSAPLQCRVTSFVRWKDDISAQRHQGRGDAEHGYERGTGSAAVSATNPAMIRVRFPLAATRSTHPQKSATNRTSAVDWNYTRPLSTAGKPRSKPRMVVRASARCLEAFKAIVHDLSPAKPSEQSVVDTLLKIRDCPWVGNRTEIDAFQTMHGNLTGGAKQVVVTRSNHPVNSSIVFDQSKKTLVVDNKTSQLLLKDFPEQTERYPRCAVVGNGGILSNSSCGAHIDQADFVIRCNIAPVGGTFEKDVGRRTDLVTSNPTILIQRFESLTGSRKEFVKKMSSYGPSVMLIPGFSIWSYTPLAYRALYSLDDAGSAQHVAFFNPSYMTAISRFWKKRGVKESHVTSGLMMTSVAMDLCEEVHVYGFWPFVNDLPPVESPGATDERPKRTKRGAKRKKAAVPVPAPAPALTAATNRTLGRLLTHHYYDDQQPKKVHSMPSEFSELLRLHGLGVLHLHVTACEAVA